jgi:hypothetical protein
MVAGRFKRGHASRVRNRPQPLTASEIDAEDDGEIIDLGMIEIPDIIEPVPGGSVHDRRAGDDPGTTPPGTEPDEPPAHAERDWRKPPAPKARGRAVRVTATIRADITAKIRMPLEIGGRIWAVRDPLCGGVFVQQVPDTADALADIVCDSADLVAFFTGPGGAFMKYLNLGAALWPVAEVVAAHHVYHTVRLEDAQQGPPVPDLSGFAA